MWRCFSDILLLIGRMGAWQGKYDSSAANNQNEEETTGIDAKEDIGQSEELSKNRCQEGEEEEDEEEDEEEKDETFYDGLEHFKEFISRDFDKIAIVTATTQALKVEQRTYVNETSKFHVNSKQKVNSLDDEGNVVFSVEQRKQGHTCFPDTCYNVNSNEKGSIMYFHGSEEKNGFELHSKHEEGLGMNKEETSMMNNSAKK